MSEIELNVKNLSPELIQARDKIQDKLIILKKKLSEDNFFYVKSIFEKTLEKENLNLSKSKNYLVNDNIENKIINLN